MTIPRNEQRDPKKRSTFRAVAVPREHGGWGLTFEPGLLGLLLIPGVAGLSLAIAALVGFLARTPLRLVLVDHHRRRSLERTRMARMVLAGELVVFAALVIAAFELANDQFWLPALVAGPFVITAFWFEMRSRGRRLVPELAGAIGVCSVVTMVVLADGGSARLAVGAWLVLGARAATSIPYVRGMIARLHGRTQTKALCAVADVGALVALVAATILDHALIAGCVAVVLVITIQRAGGRGSVPRPAVIGARQMIMGLVVVAAVAIGVHVFH
ncbi:MAG: YwiC-like family protein [Ferrimicrobium sp.]